MHDTRLTVSCIFDSELNNAGAPYVKACQRINTWAPYTEETHCIYLLAVTIERPQTLQMQSPQYERLPLRTATARPAHYTVFYVVTTIKSPDKGRCRQYSCTSFLSQNHSHLLRG
jgi:hypothetical protein